MIKLKEKREAMNLTQKQVSEQIGIAESAYQRYERSCFAKLYRPHDDGT